MNSTCSSHVLRTDERTVASPGKKLGLDERAEQRVARGSIESPQPLRLRRRKAKSGHLGVLAPNAPQGVSGLLLGCHVKPAF
jgi:hypothetical protein